MGDASRFITLTRSNAVNRGIIGNASTPHDITGAVQLGSRRFQRKSRGSSSIVVPPTLPPTLPLITSATFSVNTTFVVGTPADGDFTLRGIDSTTLLQDENFIIYRVPVDAGKTYTFNLTGTAGADPDMYVSFQNTSFTESNIVAIANYAWGRSNPSLSSFVYKKSFRPAGYVETVEVTTTAGGFFDVLLISVITSGVWTFEVITNV